MKPTIKVQTELSKLQVIASLFACEFGGDLYFARQIKESIEAALPQDQQDQVEAFIHCAAQLADRTAKRPDATGVALVPASEEQGFSLLAFRARLLAALKLACRFERPLVVLTGLKEAICPEGKRWTARRNQEYQDAIAYARAFCHARCRPSCQLSLVIF